MDYRDGLPTWGFQVELKFCTIFFSDPACDVNLRFANGQGQHKGQKHQVKEVGLSLLMFKAMKF